MDTISENKSFQNTVTSHASDLEGMDRRTKSVMHRKEAERLKKKWGINAVQVRYRETGNWYSLLKRFPAALIDRNGYMLFPTEDSYRKSPYLYIGREIGFRNREGISSMPDYKRFPKEGPEGYAIITDIKTIELDTSTDPTTKQALVNARVGQGKFGAVVREFWNYRCCITGASTAAVLEASHIKRWADSTDNERLDPNNGLLLVANLHKLFDKGLISFDGFGRLLVSSQLSETEQIILGLGGRRLTKAPTSETFAYLSDHRTKLFLG